MDFWETIFNGFFVENNISVSPPLSKEQQYLASEKTESRIMAATIGTKRAPKRHQNHLTRLTWTHLVLSILLFCTGFHIATGGFDPLSFRGIVRGYLIGMGVICEPARHQQAAYGKF